MNQKKNPGGNQGRHKKKNGKRVLFSYLVEPTLVKVKIPCCIYFHLPTAERRVGFCMFTGQDLDCPCSFMEVPHADI